ncbi:hypothetical protein [Pseudomonas sp. Root329]|uniref:hypothetical protein n=1 Tax=Pseudomonas sp. Root329 TaxID=1736515 RepID=UPI000A77F827|nr:hypothetical protein [Pseudomonas sp. Root329]
MPWYKSGTVSVALNSNAVIGTGTAFIANSRVGDAFRGPDGGWYEVTNIASDSALSVSPNYQGATNATGTYALAPMQGYVKDSADALRALVNQFGGVLAVLGNDPTQIGVRQALNLSTADGLPEGATNKYLTTPRVLAVPLTGIDLVTSGAIVATDTIIKALGKLQASKADLVGVSKVVAIEQGGTGAATAAGARAALGASGGKNLLLNPKFKINQRQYASGVAAAAGQYTLDRWRVVAAGQSLTFVAVGAGNRVTFPAGGGEQVILGENIRGGVYSLSWVGTATAKVNGVAIINGGQTASLPAGNNVTVTFAAGTAEDVMFERGTISTTFEDRNYDLELFLCQYYGYALSPSVAGQPICSMTFTYSNYTAVGVLRFPRTMRVNPTAAFLAGSPASFTVTAAGGGSYNLDNLPIAALGRDSCFLAAAISTSFPFGYGTMLNFGSSPNLFFSAEV